MKNISFEELGFYFEPLGYRILVRAPIIPEQNTVGLFVPDNSREEAARHACIGKVVGVGPSAFEKLGESFRVDVGDWVLYAKYNRDGVTVKSPDIRKDDILCWFVNDDSLLGRVPEETMKMLALGGY